MVSFLIITILLAMPFYCLCIMTMPFYIAESVIGGNKASLFAQSFQWIYNLFSLLISCARKIDFTALFGRHYAHTMVPVPVCLVYLCCIILLVSFIL